MDEEQLKSLLGENFDGAKDFFKNQVLGNGDYVRKEMSDANIAALQKKLNDANNTIKSKMTEDEKAQATLTAKDATIEELQKKLSEQTKLTNKSAAVSNITEAIGLAEIKSDDKELIAFIDNISTENAETTDSVSKYINKIVKSAYEKGKAEATKQNLGKIGNFNANKSNVTGDSTSSSLAERLAKENNVKQTAKSSYFSN